MSATIVEAMSDTMNDTPRGMSILPSMPWRKKSGRNEAMIMSEELNIGILTSLLASYTTFIIGLPSLRF